MPDTTSTPTPPAVGGHELSDEQRAQAWIASLQRDLNRFLGRLGAPTRLAVDGVWDEFTDTAFRDVCRIIGVAPERHVRTFRLIAGAAAAPTKEELARRASDGVAFEAALRAKFATAPRAHVATTPRVVLGGPSLPRAARDRAYVAFAQRTLNDHLARLGSPAILAIDGKWGKNTQRAFARVCRVLGVKPERGLRTFRILAGALATRDAAELAAAAADGKTYEAALRREFAREAAAPPPPPPPPKKPVAEDARIAAAITAHRGQYAAEIIAASRATGVPLAVICAIVEMESGFTNVFGHDGPPVTHNPIRSVNGKPNRVVTKKDYLAYRDFRRRGFGQQGVGPMQLTTASFQDRADALGGCWVPASNIRVGAEVIREKIAGPGRGNLRSGLMAYNGSGDAARAYADTMLKVIAKWQGFLATNGAASDTGGRVSPASSASTFRVLSAPGFSAEVQSFQRLINRRLAAWKVPKRIDEDGKFGKDTRALAREVASGMGIARADFINGFTPHVRRVMAHPDQRTDKQKARAASRGAYRSRLRAKYKAPATATTSSVAKLLGGHQPPRAAALWPIIRKAGGYGLVVTATTDGQHAPTSFHYSGKAVDFGVVGSLAGTPEHMRRLKAFQEAMFKEAPHLLELFGPIANHAVKNGRPTTISGPLLQQHLNHVHVAAQ